MLDDFNKCTDDDVRRVFLLLYAKSNGIFLAVKRNDDNTWGLPGGKVEDDETPYQAMCREAQQEIDFSPERIEESYRFFPVRGVGCIVYMAAIAKPFIPKLNDESLAYKWSRLIDWPTPAHPQMERVIQDNIHGFREHAKRLAFSN